MFVVRDVALEYLKPASLDDELQATARLIDMRGATMRMRQTVKREGEVLVHGDVTIACVDRSSLKPRRLPRDMTKKLRDTQLTGQ
jgi:YbgC/YbaW family acyl-CoA thioester hydrolase